MARMIKGVDCASYYKNWDEFRKQPAIREHLQDMGQRIADSATRDAVMHGFDEPDFNVETSNMGSRVRVSVLTSNYQARLAQAKYGSLTQALGAGAGEY